MQTEIVKVTPSIAKQYLATNTENNRKVKNDRVDFYANEMVSGRWVESTGEAIKFDRQGKLIDGQHRLLAVIKSNRTFRFMIVTNLDKEAFQVIDAGMARSGADMFHIQGISNSNAIAAGLKSFFGLMNGYTNLNEGGARMHLSNKLLVGMYNENPEYWNTWQRKSVHWYKGFSNVVPQAFIMGFATMLDKTSKHKGKIDQFFDELCMDMAVNPSVRLLRKRLIEDKLKRNEKLTPAYKTIYFIKIWNAFVHNKEIKQLTYNPSQEEEPKAL